MIRLLNTHTYFNPRSHEGSDGSLDLYYNYLLISIHAPTRGATFTRIVHYFHYLFQSTLPRGERLVNADFDATMDVISIHAPTRGATGK